MVLPGFILAIAMKWLESEKFLKVSSPFFGIEAGFLAHLVLWTALSFGPVGHRRAGVGPGDRERQKALALRCAVERRSRCRRPGRRHRVAGLPGFSWRRPGRWCCAQGCLSPDLALLRRLDVRDRLLGRVALGRLDDLEGRRPARW